MNMYMDMKPSLNYLRKPSPAQGQLAQGLGKLIKL